MFFSPMSSIFVGRFSNSTFRIHCCSSPTIIKLGYDQGIPWVSRGNADFYNLTAYAHRVLSINCGVVKEVNFYLKERNIQGWWFNRPKVKI